MSLRFGIRGRPSTLAQATRIPVIRSAAEKSGLPTDEPGESDESQGDLAGVFARLHQTMRFGNLCGWKSLIKDNLDFTGFQQRPDTFAQRFCDVPFLFCAPWAQCRTGDCQPAQHDWHKVKIENPASLKKRNLEQPSLERQQTNIFLDVRSAHHVENDIDAAVLRNLF